MLELRDITYAAPEEDGQAKKRYCAAVSLKVDERFVAITGPNGGGKSTLARIIAGIITPTSGSIFLDGEDITGLGVTERAKKGISFAFRSRCASRVSRSTTCCATRLGRRSLSARPAIIWPAWACARATM